MSAAQDIGKAVIGIAVEYLQTHKADILKLADAGITSADTQVKAAIDKALTAHGILGIATRSLTGPINEAIDELAKSGEADAGALFDAGVAAIAAEVAKL